MSYLQIESTFRQTDAWIPQVGDFPSQPIGGRLGGVINSQIESTFFMVPAFETAPSANLFLLKPIAEYFHVF